MAVQRGHCWYCKNLQEVREAPKEQHEALREDATSPADYYLLNEHLDPETGVRCEGVDKIPKWLEGPEDDFYLDTRDEPPPEHVALEEYGHTDPWDLYPYPDFRKKF